MPCRSDYMEPNKKERLLQETAILLGYVLEETGQPVPRSVHAAAKDIYCKTDLVPDLCAAIKSMDEETFRRVVYNPYSKESRQLADWWETHEAADRARLAQEEEERAHVEHLNSAFDKLTAQEVRALRRYFN